VYTIGATPAMFARVKAAAARSSIARLPGKLPTVTTAVRPIARGLFARAAAHATPKPAGRILAPLVARARALPARIGPTELRSIAPTAPTITPRIVPRPGSLVARVMAKAKTAPTAPRPRTMFEKLRAKARARVAARPPGSTVPVPVSPFEAQALLPPPVPTGPALPPSSPFSLVQTEPTTVPYQDIPPEVFQEEGPSDLELVEAEPVEELLAPDSDVPDWLEDVFPGSPAASDPAYEAAPTDLYDELDMYDELGQGPNLSELELQRIQAEASGATAIAAARSAKPQDILLGIGALLAVAWLLKGGSPPRGGRYGGGKASW